MNSSHRSTHISLAGAWLALTLGLHTAARAETPSAAPEETPVTARASGTFEVKLSPLPPYSAEPDSLLGRMSVDKVIHGDLEATSKGEMLSAMTPVKGSAGYVAIERVTGTLSGKRGSFVLQHSGTMARGAQQLTVTIVPDSGIP
jgi:hypothetical protein